MEEAEAIRRVAGALLTGGGAIGVGIGVGLITAKYLEGIARQPELQPYLFTPVIDWYGSCGCDSHRVFGNRTIVLIHIKISSEF